MEARHATETEEEDEERRRGDERKRRGVKGKETGRPLKAEGEKICGKVSWREAKGGLGH